MFNRIGVVWFVLAFALSACSSSDPTESTSDLSVPSGANDLSGEENDLFVPRLDVREASELTPYLSDSAYTSVLKECASVDDYRLACTLDTLPFIAQENPNFTREDILGRLLVTHTWMGDRFAAILDDAPDMMIPLFGSVTAISIGSTIRPSNYWIGTGAVQLDPATLWLSVFEKANVSIEEDFRSGFGDELQFWFFQSLRSGTEPAYYVYSLTDRQERTLEDIKIPIYRLLYHELSHAVDYLPLNSVSTLDSSKTPYNALVAQEEDFASPRLSVDLPLYSQTLNEIGQVLYRGEDATESQKTFTPTLLGSEMANDGAAKLYGYSSQREDFATLFTQAMMKFSFGVEEYIAFVNKPADLSNYACNELLVGWGQKNRLADALTLPRARWVVDSVYGQIDTFDTFFSTQIGQVSPMMTNVDWCTNRDGTIQADVSTMMKKQFENSAKNLPLDLRRLEYERRGTHH